MLKVFDVADMLLATSDVQLVRLCRLIFFLSSHFRKAFGKKQQPPTRGLILNIGKMKGLEMRPNTVLILFPLGDF